MVAIESRWKAALEHREKLLEGQGRLRTVNTVLLVFLGCYAGATLGVSMQFPDNGVALLFPSYAVLTAALLLSPLRLWWVLVLAAAAGNLPPHLFYEDSLSFVALAEVANTSRALIAAGGVLWVTGRADPFATLRDMTVFLVFAALVGPLAGAFIGAGDVVLYQRGAFWPSWQGWLISNMVTGVVLLPLLMVLVTSPIRTLRLPQAMRWMETTAMVTGFLVVALVLAEAEERSPAALLYGPLPFLIWAVVRFGPAGTVATLSAFAVITMGAALRGDGPFIGPSPTETLTELQLFLSAVSVPILLLAALIQEHARATGALAKSRAQYKSVIEDQTELICRFLADGTYTFVNEAYCRYFQRSAEQLLGTTFWQFVPASEQGAARAQLASVTPHNPVATYEHRVYAPGGEVRWQQWTDRGFFDQAGRIVEFQSVGRDVTDRHQAEEALRENEERLALAVSSARLGIWDWNLSTGNATWSEKLRSIFGRADASPEAPVDAFLAMVHPDDRERLVKTFEDSRERLGPFEVVEYRVVRPDGSVRWVATTGQTFPDGEGKAQRLVTVNRDITTRKHVEDEIRSLELQKVVLASEQGFRTLADHAPVLIWRSGLWNEGIYFNKTWLEFTGRTLEQELGFGWVESVHPDDRKSAQETCDAAFACRAPMTMQFRMRRHDGEYRWVFDNGVPYLGADGEFTGYVGTCMDITERHLAEETLQEADRHKDEFLAMLGHELRNPLAPIGAAVEVLRKSASSDPSVVWAREAIARQLRQMTKLVDDLVDVSRIARNEIELNLAPLDLAQVVPAAVEASRPLIAARDHQLSIALPNQPLPIRGDLVRLVQVVSNLLNNAANYTERGGRISLRVERDGSSAVLKVSDNGVGIPPDKLERVFNMFTQLSSQRDRSQGGLGIGLTLARRLVEGHGGTIDARSDGPSKGSEFTVRLPLARELAVSPAAADPTVAGATARSEGRARTRILIVDDNVDAAEGLSRVLRGQENEIRVVHDGLAALSATESMHPDVVLLDIGLPELDGLEVARRIRARASGRGPFLVAMTGFGQPELHKRTMEAGFDDHLTKPFDLDRLQLILQMEAARRAGTGPFNAPTSRGSQVV